MKGTKNHVLLLTGRTEHAQVPIFVSIWLISSVRFVCFAFPMPWPNTFYGHLLYAVINIWDFWVPTIVYAQCLRCTITPSFLRGSKNPKKKKKCKYWDEGKFYPESWVYIYIYIYIYILVRTSQLTIVNSSLCLCHFLCMNISSNSFASSSLLEIY